MIVPPRIRELSRSPIVNTMRFEGACVLQSGFILRLFFCCFFFATRSLSAGGGDRNLKHLSASKQQRAGKRPHTPTASPHVHGIKRRGQRSAARWTAIPLPGANCTFALSLPALLPPLISAGGDPISGRRIRASKRARRDTARRSRFSGRQPPAFYDSHAQRWSCAN